MSMSGDGDWPTDPDELVSGWAGHVRQVADEMVYTLEEANRRENYFVQTCHDYAGFLYFRDHIQKVLGSWHGVPRALERLGEIDRRLEEITGADLERLLWQLVADYHEPQKPGWWWYRVPRAGPILEELQSYYGVRRWLDYDVQSFNYGSLIEGWVQFVIRLEADTVLGGLPSTPGPGNRSPGEILAACRIRDRIEASAAGIGPIAASDDGPAVTEIDERFERFTVEDRDGVVVRLAHDSDIRPGAGWWWRRMPTVGPVAEHLQRRRS